MPASAICWISAELRPFDFRPQQNLQRGDLVRGEVVGDGLRRVVGERVRLEPGWEQAASRGFVDAVGLHQPSAGGAMGLLSDSGVWLTMRYRVLVEP